MPFLIAELEGSGSGIRSSRKSPPCLFWWDLSLGLMPAEEMEEQQRQLLQYKFSGCITLALLLFICGIGLIGIKATPELRSSSWQGNNLLSHQQGNRLLASNNMLVIFHS